MAFPPVAIHPPAKGPKNTQSCMAWRGCWSAGWNPRLEPWKNATINPNKNPSSFFRHGHQKKHAPKNTHVIIFFVRGWLTCLMREIQRSQAIQVGSEAIGFLDLLVLMFWTCIYKNIPKSWFEHDDLPCFEQVESHLKQIQGFSFPYVQWSKVAILWINSSHL